MFARFWVWLKGVGASIAHEVQSRKFRALVVVLLGDAKLFADGTVDAHSATYAAVIAIVGYMFGVAAEDFAAKLGK